MVLCNWMPQPGLQVVVFQASSAGTCREKFGWIYKAGIRHVDVNISRRDGVTWICVAHSVPRFGSESWCVVCFIENKVQLAE